MREDRADFTRRRRAAIALAGVIAIALLVTALALADATGSLRVRLELARVRIGDRDFPLATLIAPAGPSFEERAVDAQRVVLPEIRAEGTRFFLRDTARTAELVPLASEEKEAGSPQLYRVEGSTTEKDAGAAAETDATSTIRKVGSGDFIEWVVVGPEGLERTLRVVRSGAPRWRVASIRDPDSREVAALEYDAEGRLTRIVTSAGIEWHLDYQRSAGRAAADLAQITARTSVTSGAEMLYRARLEYDAFGSSPRLSHVTAASRVPAGVAELSFVYEESDGAKTKARSAGDATRRLREIRTPRGEVEPRFDYDEAGAFFVLSAVPNQDAYDVRYPVTIRLAPEYVGEDILEDALGRRTLAFDESSREEFELRVENGLLLGADGTPLDTGGAPFLIVLAPDGKLYGGRGDYSSESKLHHSSFLAGQEVAAAGEVVVRRGQVVRVTSRSGHYKPPMCLLDQLSAEFARRGVKLDDVPFEKGY